MIIFPLFALLVGFLLVYVLLGDVSLPLGYADYISLIILASLDAIAGGARARLEGRFDDAIFITGVIFNSLAAVALTYIGDRMGMSLYLAPMVALGVRIFYNMGRVRRLLMGRSEVGPAAAGSELERTS
ncbi:MAG: small basic family protein [Armatimonadota bacterium]|nr:MAG: small basic family protein [Armatimonadota bacterium]